MLNKRKKNLSKDLLRKNIPRKEKHNNLINDNIFQLIENNNLNKLSDLFKKDHSKINSLNKDGLSPLHLSIIKGNIDIISLLLLNGANPNILSTKKKQSPLHLAYIYQNSKTNEIIQKLKAFKAKENIYDNNNKKPIDYLNKKSVDKIIKKNEINKFKKRISEKKEKKSIEKNNLNRNISVGNSYNRFSKMIVKIEGDIDNCENDYDNNFENIDDGLIQQEHYCPKNNKNKINKIYNNNSNKYEINDIKTTNLTDSLEKENQPENNQNKKKIESLQTRNKPIKKKNNSLFNYPILFNNIINNNLKRKNNNEIKNELFHNNSHKIFQSPNNINSKATNDNNSQIEEVFKEIINKKRESIKLRKSNSFFRIKKYNQNNNLYSKENKYINSSNYNDLSQKKIKDRNISKTSTITQNNTGVITGFSTENKQTKKRNIKDKITIIKNKDVIEFKYGDSFTEENDNTEKISKNNSMNNTIKNSYISNTNTNNNIINNTSFNVLNKDTLSNNENYTNVLSNKKKSIKNTDINDSQMIKSCVELKNWLDNIELSIYFENFIENDIYDINILINQMKNPETKLGYDDIETFLKMHKPGHIYRLLCNLEIDAGLINDNVAKFLIIKNNNKIIDKNINSKLSNNKLKLSICQGNNSCTNCGRINFLSSNKKNDLNSFLNRYNLSSFYQNFYHNGFNLINFVMIQMFSTEPIDDIILENCFHIYEAEQRENVLRCINE